MRLTDQRFFSVDDDDVTFRMNGNTYTRAALYEALEAEAAAIDPAQWVDGRFVARDYAVEAINTGLIEIVWPGDTYDGGRGD